jgi:branched-chain amino acid transport system permease protein
MVKTSEPGKVAGLNWKAIVQYGLISGLAIVYVSLVGMVETFDDRDVIYRVLSLGLALLVVISLGMGYLIARKISGGNMGKALGGGLVVGLMSSVVAAIFVWLIDTFNLREMFVNASPALVKILTFDQQSLATGLLMLAGMLTGSSLLGAAIYSLPGLLRRMVMVGLCAVLLVGMLEEFLSRIGIIKLLSNVLFGREGLSVSGAIIVFVFFAGLDALWSTQGRTIKRNVSTLPPNRKRALNWTFIVIGVIFLLIFPRVTDPFISQIAFLIGLYILMGLGLNIDVGFAGLLDLGFVGFFAIGAYTAALLTSTADLGVGQVIAPGIDPTHLFWLAVPIAVLVSAFFGVFLGIPVLRMRGDYLAIVTLGFAEIIRILVLSDFLRPFLGGAQGILRIPKPVLNILNAIEVIIKDPGHFYYLVLVGCSIIAFITWRLQNARIGRNWMAMREDEDVAEAMGINLVANKLLAFGIGASFAGLSGAIFSAQLGSVFPHSFKLDISISVLSLIIIGGIGSIPGVIVGALIVVGLPQLLREFAEFQPLIFGMLLVVMMLLKPEGFWPSEVRRRELREGETVETEARSSVSEPAWEVSETVST